ncbi:MAG: GNAT family N-acetyltransferase [Actinomycetota bacterium]
MIIREARDDDAWDLIGLIAGCWSEYPGCILDVHGEVPELLAIATHYQRAGGKFWVAQSNDRVVGCIGIVPASDSLMTLVKLYVARAARSQGLGAQLVELVESEAADRGATSIDLWSDTRFKDAHRLYERLGYELQSETRELHDLSNSVEFHFLKNLETPSMPPI